ncbi:MAG: septum formation family protein, partial [Pseudonocardiaceae bacterium]
MSATRLDVVDCALPHELEAFHVVQLPNYFPDAYPTAATLLPRFEPQCRARLPDYLGSPDVDASRLREYVYWPSPQGWNEGQRWVLCAVGEAGADDQPLPRTGALSGALRDGLGQFQACSKDPPSVATLRVVPCSEPHRGEAIPGGVLVLGAPSEPPVTAERANAAADPYCRRAAAAFLGDSAARPGVRYSWRYPLPESWPHGYTAVVCYLETDAPMMGSLR